MENFSTKLHKKKKTTNENCILLFIRFIYFSPTNLENKKISIKCDEIKKEKNEIPEKKNYDYEWIFFSSKFSSNSKINPRKKKHQRLYENLMFKAKAKISRWKV